jgi:uncharacterized protein DUF664
MTGQRRQRAEAVPTSPWTEDLRGRLDELLDEYREGLLGQLDDLTEEEARRSLVPSKTTLLGLVKHITYVERVWFDQAVTGRSLREIGAASTPDRSFVLTKDDTVASVSAAHRDACEDSRRAVAGLGLDDVVTGRGSRPVWALYLQMLRELAHHSGHADILREQILAARSAPPSAGAASRSGAAHVQSPPTREGGRGALQRSGT